MRILSLVFSFLVTLAVTVLALAYVPRYVGRQRIYLEPPGIAIPDTAWAAAADSDRYAGHNEPKVRSLLSF